MRIPTLLAIHLLAIVFLASCSQAKLDWISTLETEHFVFHTVDSDRNAVLPLADVLERNYERITADLRLTDAPRFPVYVAPDIESYHRAIGRPDASPQSVGTAIGTEIWMVSPLNPGNVHDTQAILTIGVHEFTHAVVNLINGSLSDNDYSIPIWLNEGLAVHEAGQMTPEWRERLAERVALGHIPTIADDLVPDRFNQVGGYAFSATIVEYLITEYGFEKIVAIIESPSEMESILGITVPELEIAWRQYLERGF